MKSLKFGFTLIELLVVISIIGLVSSIALASVKTARDRAADSAIRSDLLAVRTQAQIYFSQFNSYTTSFTLENVGQCTLPVPGVLTDLKVSAAMLAAGNASSGGGIGATFCMANTVAYVVAAPLRTNPARAWCVDYLNNSLEVATSFLAANTAVSCVN